jgi:hypothetical protein
MSTHVYTRNRVGDGWDLDIRLLAQETRAALPGKNFKVGAADTVVTFAFVETLTASEIRTLDDTVAANRAAGPYIPKNTPVVMRLVSPDGSSWELAVDNAGALSTRKI